MTFAHHAKISGKRAAITLIESVRCSERARHPIVQWSSPKPNYPDGIRCGRAAGLGESHQTIAWVVQKRGRFGICGNWRQRDHSSGARRKKVFCRRDVLDVRAQPQKPRPTINPSANPAERSGVQPVLQQHTREKPLIHPSRTYQKQRSTERYRSHLPHPRSETRRSRCR